MNIPKKVKFNRKPLLFLNNHSADEALMENFFTFIKNPLFARKVIDISL